MDERSIEQTACRAETSCKSQRISIKDDARGPGTHGLRRTGDRRSHGKRAPGCARTPEQVAQPPNAMTRAELIAAASPPCHECGAPVQRIEIPWHLDEDGTWRLRYFMICSDEHRVLVEPLV
jgi:hypothetical protein